MKGSGEMSIDLEVKLPSHGLAAGTIFAAIEREWASLNIATDKLAIVGAPSDADIIKGDIGLVNIAVADSAFVSCYFHFQKPDPTDSDTGLWVTVSPRRERESILLMFAVSAAFARLAASQIVDDGEILGKGKRISICSFEVAARLTEGLTLQQAAAAVFPADPFGDGRAS